MVSVDEAKNFRVAMKIMVYDTVSNALKEEKVCF